MVCDLSATRHRHRRTFDRIKEMSGAQMALVDHGTLCDQYNEE
jgi:hypothetical protein